MDGFFSASKVFWFLVAPSNLLALLTVLALALRLARRRRAGMACLAVAATGWLVLGFLPVSNYLLNPLEDRFPVHADDGQPITGVLMLGGAEIPEVGLARGMPAYGDAAERAIALGGLARQYPDARLVFVGGSGRLFPMGSGLESRMTRLTLPLLGIPADRVAFEENSRNTAENAQFAKAMLDPRPGERWLLLTSAFHMPRAMGAFRKVGFPVIAYPVDFRTADDRLDVPYDRVTTNLDMTDVAVKEWVGLLVYYLSGKTSALFPAP